MTDLQRVSTRDFLRNINSMTKPVHVYTRDRLKGTWIPAETGAFNIAFPSIQDRGVYIIDGWEYIPVPGKEDPA